MDRLYGSGSILQLADEEVYLLLCHMLHHHDVGQLAAKALVESLRQGVFGNDFGRGATEEHGVAVLVGPCRPADGIELLFEVGRALHDSRCLARPSFGAHLLDNPPEPNEALKELFLSNSASWLFLPASRSARLFLASASSPRSNRYGSRR